MKLTISKTDDNRVERKIIDGEILVFHDFVLYSYMDLILIDKEKSIDMVNQLKSLFNGITEIENEFDI